MYIYLQRLPQENYLCKRAKIIPIVKLEKQKGEDVSKFHPTSLLNIGGKVLEKALISRTNHNVFS